MVGGQAEERVAQAGSCSGGGRQRAGTAPRGQGPQAGGGAWAGALGASLRPLGQAVAEVSVSLQEDKLAKTSF